MTTRAIGSRFRASVRRTNGRPTVWLDESGGPGMKHGAAFNVRSVTEWPTARAGASPAHANPRCRAGLYDRRGSGDRFVAMSDPRSVP